MDQAAEEVGEPRPRDSPGRPPVGARGSAACGQGVYLLDDVVAVSAPPSEIRERERRVMRKVWHLFGNRLPCNAQPDLAQRHCPDLQSAEGRLEVAKDARSTAEMARWWDCAACVEVLDVVPLECRAASTDAAASAKIAHARSQACRGAHFERVRA